MTIQEIIEMWTGCCSDGEGGGGGGDFKTLTMTVVGDGGDFYMYAYADGDYADCSIVLGDKWVATGGARAMDEQEVAYTVVYNGDSATLIPGNTMTSITGSATYDEETNTITATGNFKVSGFVSD